MMPKLICLLATALMLVTGAATAHSWYPQECCHDNDCRPVPCAELSYHGKDVVWRKHIYFSGSTIRESRDGSCHVCVKEGLNAGIIPYLPLYSLSTAVHFRPARHELSAMMALNGDRSVVSSLMIVEGVER
jgi:hypothetical protein